MTATDELAGFAAGLRFERLPPEIVTHTKQSILDMIGVALAGAGVGSGCDEIVNYAKSAGQSGDSSVWSSGLRLPAAQAALVNGAHGRALDYDDIIVFPQIHVAACVVPAVVAVAQSRKNTVTGRDLVTAVAVGCELQSRLAAAIAPFFGEGLPVMLSSQVFGYFSAAAACANLLKLRPAEMQSAFGLALMHCAGTEEMVVHAADSIGKCLYAGLSSQGGVQSAMMARHGVRARGDALTGQAGLFGAYYNGAYDGVALTADLNARFLSADRCIKAMPGTLVSHAFAEAALELMKTHHLVAEQVARVELHVGPWGRIMCEPAEMRRRPSSASAAMNSIPFIVAKVIVNGAISLDDFQDQGRTQPSALAMTARIDHIVDPALAAPRGLEPGLVDFVLKDGRRLSQRIDAPQGHPARPISTEGVVAKFTANARRAKPSRSHAAIDRLIDRTMRLDSLDDVGLLFDAIDEHESEGVL